MRRYLQPIMGPPGQRNHFTSDTNRAGDWITLAGRSSLTDVVHRRLHSNTVACERARHWEFIHTTHRTSERKEGPRCGSLRPSPPAPIILLSQNIMGESMTLGTARVDPGSSPMLFRGITTPADMPSALPSSHISPRSSIFVATTKMYNLRQGSLWGFMAKMWFLDASSSDGYGSPPDVRWRQRCYYK